MKPALVCSSSEILGHQTLPFILPFKNWASALFIKLVILPPGECTLTSVSPLLETYLISCLMAAGRFHKASVLWITSVACSRATELFCPGTDDKRKNRRHTDMTGKSEWKGDQAEPCLWGLSDLSSNPDSAWTTGFQWQRFYQWLYEPQAELSGGDGFSHEQKTLKGRAVIKYVEISLQIKK